MSAYHFLCGRECLIHLGKQTPTETIEDVRTVEDFWRRLTLAQRGDGTLDNKDAGFTNRYLPDAEVAYLVGRAAPLDESAQKALKRLNATVSGYSFLHFTDSRVGIYDSGPYRVSDDQVAIVRDYLCLQKSVFGYPWAVDLTAPYDGLTMVLLFDPAAFEEFEINDWGTTFTEPDQLLSLVTWAAVVGNHSDGSRVDVPAADWPGLIADLGKTHLQLYETFAAMNRTERVIAATQMYSWGLKPFAEIAGVLDQIDWEISDATMDLYPTLSTTTQKPPTRSRRRSSRLRSSAPSDPSSDRRRTGAMTTPHAAYDTSHGHRAHAHAHEINPGVVAVMNDLGRDLAKEFPRPLTDDAVRGADVVITTGCGDACSIHPGKRYLDWSLDDPAGLPTDRIRILCGDTDRRVRTSSPNSPGNAEGLLTP